jgi:hypothetical protein
VGVDVGSAVGSVDGVDEGSGDAVGVVVGSAVGLGVADASTVGAGVAVGAAVGLGSGPLIVKTVSAVAALVTVAVVDVPATAAAAIVC